jgi:NAD(P)-dependent dehydrogenase (short-subunit alcohol dehydrogenase family)
VRHAGWSLADVPDLTGRRVLVTGVTSGVGEQTAMELAKHGAEVVMAARTESKLAATVRDVERAVPAAQVHPVILDLADLASVRRAAAEAAALGPLHLLVNNAGVMATPYHRTVDGFELQMGTNHFGHFALTGLLLPQLAASGGARVVTVSSQGHRLTRKAPLHDPRAQPGRYRRWSSYAKSKLSNLLFTFELERRAHAAGLAVHALAAHPGYSATGLMQTGTSMGRATPWSRILNAGFGLLAQPAELGALPTLMAATADLPGGTYVGPSGFAEMRGMPTVVGTRKLARDAEVARELWEISESATAVHYDFSR